jgi:aryl-alcohol dehydrogenase-like predicted oxidoreductase
MGAPVNDSESIAALHEALDCGVNSIDTELTSKW